ncbi:Malate dehydrogenase, glyoxysomal [Hibiscus syriacus]|uniref:malate dehydrogenase n=1 Tax=Hibiscus syriacus TaxID=106335 RepID=A0A6A3CAA6_HIBSY|nr:Malate dehydrogenase, glyoxysomal [Hibiscus syriacus]
MEANQRIAKIAAHLQPSYPQLEESSALRLAECRAKGRSPGFKVAILGAAGIGQPLAMLMKMNPLSVLHLYDVVNSPGVTADLSHMDTDAKAALFQVRGFLGQPQLESALTGMGPCAHTCWCSKEAWNDKG